jgi:hypothetical protein
MDKLQGSLHAGDGPGLDQSLAGHWVLACPETNGRRDTGHPRAKVLEFGEPEGTIVPAVETIGNGGSSEALYGKIRSVTRVHAGSQPSHLGALVTPPREALPPPDATLHTNPTFFVPAKAVVRGVLLRRGLPLFRGGPGKCTRHREPLSETSRISNDTLEGSRLLLNIRSAGRPCGVANGICPIVCPVISEPGFLEAQTDGRFASHVSLDFDEVSVLQHSFPKGPCILAGIMRRPLRQIDKGLAIEHKRNDFLRVLRIPLKPHASQGEPDGFATDGGLRLVRWHPGSVDTMLASRIDLKSRPEATATSGCKVCLAEPSV